MGARRRSIRLRRTWWVRDVLFEATVTWLLQSRQGEILGRATVRNRGCLNAAPLARLSMPSLGLKVPREQSWEEVLRQTAGQDPRDDALNGDHSCSNV